MGKSLKCRPSYEQKGKKKRTPRRKATKNETKQGRGEERPGESAISLIIEWKRSPGGWVVSERRENSEIPLGIFLQIRTVESERGAFNCNHSLRHHVG